MADTPTHVVRLRVRDDILSLIDHAARAHGKPRSDFMSDAARRAAGEVLLDQILVRVDSETYEHFVQVLDEPPSGAGFDRLMSAKMRWNGSSFLR